MKNRGFFLIALFIFLSIKTTVIAVDKEVIYSSVTPIPAIEYSLPYPGILPDHLLYPLKALRDRILLFFTRDPVKRININLLLSDKRMAMGQILWDNGKVDLSLTTFSKAQKYLLTSSLGLGTLKRENNLPPGLADKVEMAAKKHEEMINKLMVQTTDETKKQNLSQSLGINHQAMQQILTTK